MCREHIDSRHIIQCGEKNTYSLEIRYVEWLLEGNIIELVRLSSLISLVLVLHSCDVDRWMDSFISEQQ